MVASTSPSAPLISIVGITGTQGGSVAQHIIKSKTEYRLRGLTRDILKNSAQTWVNEGVELVQADINSSEDLKKAFAGATYVFAVTNFFETMDKDKEAEQGKRLVDAAKAAQVKLLVWSGLEDITKASHGKYPHVAFFDSKAIVTEYAKSVGIPLAVVTGGFFMSNLQTMMVPQKQEDGTFLLTLPISKETPMAVINASKDFGAFVVSAIEFGAGSHIYAASERLSFESMTKIWSEASGKTVKFQEVSDEDFLKFVPQGQGVVDMLRFFQEFGYWRGRDLSPYKAVLAQPISSFADWARSVDWTKTLA